MLRSALVFAWATVSTLTALSTSAQQASLIPDPAGVQDEAPPEGYAGLLYTRQEVMIPARDGVKLHTVIYRPKNSAKTGPPLPFLMQRTPYGVAGMTARAIESGKPELAASGYIFVYQDIRGRYGSGGKFVMNRPLADHANPAAVDETTDTRDTVDWLLKKSQTTPPGSASSASATPVF